MHYGVSEFKLRLQLPGWQCMAQSTLLNRRQSWLDPLVLIIGGGILATTSLAISLTVNTVVTGLIVLRIVKVYWEVQPTPEDRDLGVGGENGRLRSIIFIIIESGMAMFSIQLVWVVLYILSLDAVYLLICINQMFFVIIQSVISIFHFTEIICRD